MKYIPYREYKAGMTLGKDVMVLMSHDEFVNGGSKLRGVPLAITPDGSEPKDEMPDIGMVVADDEN